MVISRVCEEFGCLPTEALRELEQAPRGLIADILDLRAFTATKAALDRAKPGSGDAPTGPMADRVHAVIKDIADERKAAHTKMLLDAGDSQ